MPCFYHYNLIHTHTQPSNILNPEKSLRNALDLSHIKSLKSRVSVPNEAVRPFKRMQKQMGTFHQ